MYEQIGTEISDERRACRIWQHRRKSRLLQGVGVCLLISSVYTGLKVSFHWM
jgi:hypothetical protein